MALTFIELSRNLAGYIYRGLTEGRSINGDVDPNDSSSRYWTVGELKDFFNAYKNLTWENLNCSWRIILRSAMYQIFSSMYQIFSLIPRFVLEQFTFNVLRNTHSTSWHDAKNPHKICLLKKIVHISGELESLKIHFLPCCKKLEIVRVGKCLNQPSLEGKYGKYRNSWVNHLILCSQSLRCQEGAACPSPHPLQFWHLPIRTVSDSYFPTEVL